MAVFMDKKAGVEAAISLGIREIKVIHRQGWTTAIRLLREYPIIHSGPGLDVNSNGIPAETALVAVVELEVSLCGPKTKDPIEIV
jgi:hypothetical protein